MATVVRSIDIGAIPELLRIVEDVVANGEAVLLTVGERDLALLEPAHRRDVTRLGRKMTPEELEAFRSTAGAWKGVVDGDKLLREIYAGRGRPMEPDGE